ncbi:MAG: hypothetical protein PWP23_1324 [Candidatus Sumerlaeota bacterium]|nr:hypothetical protein [Candidatus Sumerlaeota bacterium]
MSSLSFLQNPLFWSLGALLPLLVVFYLLKLKRKRVTMPSTLLWRRSVQDLIANAPFQKLRNNILLWLQLLLLALLILAFMRPVMKLENLGGTTVVLLIDNSASMASTEANGMTRLELAQKAAREALDTLGNRDEAIVISFSDRTNVVQTLTSDRGALRAAINSIQVRDVETTLQEAGLILQGLTTYTNEENTILPRENTKTIILSDGVIDALDSLTDVPNVEYVRIGESTDNIGISGIDVREAFTDTFEYQIFASVTNATDEEQTAYVELQVNGELLDVRSATVAPRQTSGVVFSTGEVLEGMATLTLDSDDALKTDNLARALIAPPTDINVLLVSADNYFLEQVLQIDPRITISKIRPADYLPSDEYDIVVFDNCTTGDLPPGNFLFVNALPPIEGFALNDPADATNPQVIDWNRVHPLNRFCNFDGLQIGKSLSYTAPRSSVSILEALQTDLITLQETDTQRIVVVGFDIFQSYWPLDVSFPIFMSNLVDYFSRNRMGLYQPSYATGSAIAIYPDKEAVKATVTSPSGRTHEFSFDGISTAYMTETHEAGVYTVEFDTGTRYLLPVNLQSPSESLIAPADELAVGGREIIGTDQVVKTNQEIWHWLALAALLFLLIEWFIYTRRTFM